jgi:hypothetical protein
MSEFKKIWKDNMLRISGILDDYDLLCVACKKRKRMPMRLLCEVCQKKSDICKKLSYELDRKLTKEELLKIWADSSEAFRAGWF